MIAGLISRLHALRDRHLLRVPPRSENPYLTHIPVLLAVARWRRVTSVLEFGCGEISTRTFLDRRHFPDLQRLVSLENDAAWADRLRQQTAGEPRLQLREVAGPIAPQVEGIDLEEFDLVFIDDSTTGGERGATIRAVAARHPRRPLVVIHDFEFPPYRVAARPFRHRHRFAGLNPNTGLLWNEGTLSRSKLRALDRLLRRTGDRQDVAAWETALAGMDHPPRPMKARPHPENAP